DLDPPLPGGYDYDLIAPEVTLKRISVRNGRLWLPDGMNYSALVLPNGDRMTPKLLRRLKELVESGATVIGPRPVKSPSLSDYPQCDQEVAKLAAELWGPCDGKTVKEHRCGKGVVVWGRRLEEVLAQSGVGPDFQTLGTTSGFPVRWIHKRA